MPFKTPTGGVLLGRLHRGLLMALIAAVMLAVVLPVTVTPVRREDRRPLADPGSRSVGLHVDRGWSARTCRCRWTGVTPMAPPSCWR